MQKGVELPLTVDRQRLLSRAQQVWWQPKRVVGGGRNRRRRRQPKLEQHRHLPPFLLHRMAVLLLRPLYDPLRTVLPSLVYRSEEVHIREVWP